MPDKSPGEFELIAWIRTQARTSDQVSVGIGDDCAVVTPTPGRQWLVTTDMLMDGRHFRLEHDPAEAVGAKALGVNLSDIAAMAGTPVAALLAVALPRRSAADIARGIIQGMRPLADEFGVNLIGGDTNAWDGPLVISVTLLGQTSELGPLRRSGARPGDWIVVTGPLGGSLLGRHLNPRPRLLEALEIHRLGSPSAAIDISDGLASDLGHILDESGSLGAELDATAIPIHDDAQTLANRDGRSPLDHALNDGEDFELCLTLAPSNAARLLAASERRARVIPIGKVTAEPGIRLRDANGAVAPLVPQGFDHLK